ncbi:MAG: cell division protein FtsA [bacterium]|nr:cell division protein FtsA [bacterium]
MNENSRYIAGVDVGTTTIRVVVASLNSENEPTIVGVGVKENTGMKKGVISHLSGPAEAIDEALGEAERTSGYQIDKAAFSLNGSHILSTKTDGMVALTSSNQEVSEGDLERLEEVSTIGKIPANREILEFIPYDYILDGQDGISDPFGMHGTRLEVRANVVSGLVPHINNLRQVAEQTQIEISRIMPSVLAASNAVLSDKQKENGVAVVDFGATTTGVAIFEDGYLQYLRVIPIGGNNITNDLAICLKVTPEIAEEIKIKHAFAGIREDSKDIMVKNGHEHYSFSTIEIDEVVDARLEEIFEEIQKEFKKAGCAKQLPNGVVLVGGGANLKNLAQYSKKTLELASQIGKIEISSTISKDIKNPEFAVAVGLMLEDMKNGAQEKRHDRFHEGFFAKIFKRNK